MKRFKVTIQYDGLNFYGFQRQIDLRTVQGEIEKVLFRIFKTEVTLHASGRTDAGVHATGQVIHFDVETNMDEKALKRAMNTYLPKDIHVVETALVTSEFHARFSSIKKEYRYFINTGGYEVFSRNHVYQFNRELDIEKIKEASKLFIGKHNFYNFCTNEEGSVKDYIRTIESIEVNVNEGIIEFIIIGDGFLRNMIRMMIGALLEIGLNRKGKEYISRKLGDDFTRSNYKVPGLGLYLTRVYY